MNNDEWHDDFSFKYYGKMLDVISSRFTCIDFPGAISQPSRKADEPTVIMRHDIDLDVKRTLNIAGLEKEHDLKATYMIMLRSPFYEVSENKKEIRKLIDMGNDIGLHFHQDDMKDRSLKELEDDIKQDCDLLEDLLSTDVGSVSIHAPSRRHMWCEGTRIAGRVYSYSKVFEGRYISDSSGRFRVGEPIEYLKGYRNDILQFLTHPIWWGQRHASNNERLRGFVKERMEDPSDVNRKREIERSVLSHLHGIESVLRGPI